MTDEQAFLEDYDAVRFPAVAVTVDVALFTLRAGRLCVLLIRRGDHPFKGRWALPGGFIMPGEDLDQAAARELREETGLVDVNLEQLRSYGAPKRDPRMRVVTVTYIAVVPDADAPDAASDAADARFWPVEDLLPAGRKVLAFDHDKILADARERVQAELEHSLLAALFCEPEFTIAELRRVYEAIWGVELDPANFQRKVTSIPGFLIATDQQSGATSAGGRPARLFRLGEAKSLQPPISRPGK